MATSRAAIYARISRDAEDEGLGVARQVQDCERRAARDAFTVVDTYIDNDISASTGSRKPRPEYDRLLTDARAGRFEVVLAYSNSRLTRRPRELEDIIDHHDRHGTRFLTVVSGDDDLSTADGRMTARIKASVDAAEAERTSERLRRKHQQLAESGRHIGPRPFGWDFNDDRTLRINQAEAAVLRECVQRVLAGEGIWKITKDLNARGVPTSTGKTWATQVLRRVLLRWRNCGLRSHQPLDKDGRRTGPVALSPGQWGPIIDRETHERVVATLTAPERRTNNRGTEPKYLLTSVAYCGQCGGHVVGTNEFTYEVKGGLRKDGTRGPSRTRTYPHAYKCPTAGCMKVQRTMADVDEHVTTFVLALLARDGVRLLGGDPVAAEQARERIAALKAQLDLAVDRYADGEWTDEQVTRLNARLRPQIEAEEARLRQAQPDTAMADWADADADVLRERWTAADVETRKALIRRLGVKVTIHRVGSGNAGDGYDPSSVSIVPA
jgi:DNA invertase Pin-like site-specific DNA recombinase